MITDLTFLEEGSYTQRTKLVRKIADGIRKSPERPLKQISVLVSSLKFDETTKPAEFRKRTASEVLESGYVTGCSDVGIAFLVLAREFGIPAKYIETLSKDFIEHPSKCVEGHVFAEIFWDGKWRPHEPKRGFNKENKFILNGRIYVEVGAGLDFSGVYLKNADGEYEAEPINLQDIYLFCRTRYPKK